MEFDKYSFQFAQLAILNGYTTEYVDSCLKYAKKLADNNLPIIYDSEHFSELVGFKLSYIKTVVEYPKSFYWEGPCINFCGYSFSMPFWAGVPR